MADDPTTTAPPDAPAEPTELVNSFFKAPDTPEAAPEPETPQVDPEAAPAADAVPDAAPDAAETAPADGEPAPDPLERSYSDLAARDRALQERMERIRAAESDLRTFQTLQQTAAQDPAAALRALNIDPMTLPERLLGIEPMEQAPPPTAAGLSREEASQLFSEQLSHQKQVWDEEQQISQMIRGSEMPLIKDRIARDPRLASEIHKEAVRRYQETQTLPDIGQLLQEREDWEQANLFASLDRVMKLDIVKERYKIGDTKPPAPTKPAPSGASPTLTQTLKEEPSTSEREMTDEEKWLVFREGAKTLIPQD